MTTSSLQSGRWAALTLWGLVGLLVAPALAPAQTTLGTDPYRPYNGDYAKYAYPFALDNFAAASNERSRNYTNYTNTMDRFYEDLYGAAGASGEPTRRPSGRGMPYYSANRMYDSIFKKPAQPEGGETADEKFFQDQQKRAHDYYEALQEKDPRRRAAKMKLIEQENQRAARELSPAYQATAAARARRAVAAKSATPAPARGPATATTPRPAASFIPGRSTTTPNPRGSAPARTPAAAPRTPASNAPARTPTGERPSDILDRALRTQPAAPAGVAAPKPSVTAPAVTAPATPR